MVGRIEIRKWMQADLACSGLLSSASANRGDMVGQFLSQYYKAGTERTEMQLVTGYLHTARSYRWCLLCRGPAKVPKQNGHRLSYIAFAVL